MFLRIALTGLAAVGLFCLLVTTVSAASRTTTRFAEQTYSGNQFEILSSEAALQKSSDANVKAFAQQMIDDHTKAGQDFDTVISSSKEQLLPSRKIDPKHQRMIDNLNKMSGPDFDKQYIKDQGDAHKEMISLFTDYESKGDDQALKDFAARTLPALRQHQERITQLSGTVGR